ncbi:unnamed protein product, partial [Vitis vinifera]|uniref:Reticulon-like protein n=1 Tax=Vitis vinifera TaxID=29760 RepID=D7SWH6_VITVI
MLRKRCGKVIRERDNGGNIFWVLSDCRHYFRLYCVNAWLKLNASCHVSHIFILSLAILFFWSHTPTFINKSPPHIPEVHILGDPFPRAVNALTIEINRSFSMLREIASGRDLKKSLIIIAGLWVLSMDERWNEGPKHHQPISILPIFSCSHLTQNFFFAIFLRLNCVHFSFMRVLPTFPF